MLKQLVVKDLIFEKASWFIADEVPFNLLHRIVETDQYFGVKWKDGKLIFAQTPGHNGWLWISKEVEDTKNRINELIHHLGGNALLGISSEPAIAEMFAKIYAELNSINYETNMLMESYFCPSVIKPLNITGHMKRATIQHLALAAEFLAGFLEDAHGISVSPATQISSAQKVIDTGNVYLWIVDGHPVSMANIAHRSPRHARINSVYTPITFRKKGYASALVAEMCSLIFNEGLTPMLYTDLKNPTSNKIYKQIGFIECGKIADIRFDF